MTLRAWGAVFAALILSACATPKYPVPAPGPIAAPAPAPVRRPPRVAEPVVSTLDLLPVSALPHWASDDHQAAYDAYRQTCHAAREEAAARVCRSARAIGPLSREDARRFFEANFRAERSPPAGVLTAYFAPVYEARRRPDDEFTMPVRPKPADTRSYAGVDRAAIEAQPLDRALAWMRPEDLFFLQIQGSGALIFDDGRRMKVLYAANNGLPFVGIANPMREQGMLAANNTSGEAIRGWLAEHRGPEAQAVMNLNPRYAFFSLAPDDGREPVGAANIPLPAGRAIAVDPAFHAYGELTWIDAEAPILAGAFPTYRRLVTALDTGGAIKGEVRADLYLGSGQAAGTEAGRVRHTLRMYRLVPYAP